MPVNRSHGKPRAEGFRHDGLPSVDPAALTAPERDAETGRFVPGNAASRRRKLIKTARALPWLDPGRCEPWLRPYVQAARDHSVDLLATLPAGEPLLAGLAEEVAVTRVVARALLARGLEGDPAALEAARGWLRDARQGALSLAGLARGVEPADEDDLAKRRAEFQQRLADQQRTAIETGGEEP